MQTAGNKDVVISRPGSGWNGRLFVGSEVGFAVGSREDDVRIDALAAMIVSEKHGISAKGLQRQFGFTRYESVWTWLRRAPRFGL